jgi:hypothetical protein
MRWNTVKTGSRAVAERGQRPYVAAKYVISKSSGLRNKTTADRLTALEAAIKGGWREIVSEKKRRPDKRRNN